MFDCTGYYDKRFLIGPTWLRLQLKLVSKIDKNLIMGDTIVDFREPKVSIFRWNLRGCKI